MNTRKRHLGLRALIGVCLLSFFLLPAQVVEARLDKKHGFVSAAFEGDCESLVAGQIQSARRELLVAIYIMTSKRLENLITTAAQRGVTVRVKYDVNQASHSSMQRVLKSFEEAGIEAVPIVLKRSGASMHNKFVVVDGLRVVTGSYNFTEMAASFNYENCVLIESQAIARQYTDIFEAIESR